MPPIINDVCTDLECPLAFVKAKAGDLPETFKEQIRSGYPDLKALIIHTKPKAEVYEAAVKLAKEEPSMSITSEDEAAGVVEGVATTKLMRFKDDFVIRIKEEEGAGVVVDMRSRSRLGKGDMGKNAARIRDFFSKLKTALGEEPAAADATGPTDAPAGGGETAGGDAPGDA